MRRRAFLAAAGAVAVAGCAGGSTPRVTDRRFERRECESEPDDHRVTFDGEAGRVDVTGCIRGRNGCARLEPGGASYDAASDTLTVTVRETYEGEVCTMALVSLGYRYRVTFEGRLPETVEVAHEGDGERRVVETASR